MKIYIFVSNLPGEEKSEAVFVGNFLFDSFPQQDLPLKEEKAHSALIPNICIQTSHKGPNFSLFERTPSLPP